MTSHLTTTPDGFSRCFWCGTDPLYMSYHDEEWGRPVAEDRRLFEKIVLEGFQAGLSWLTILRKRENFRQAFDAFDIEKVARYDQRKVRALPKTRNRPTPERSGPRSITRSASELIDKEGSIATFFRRNLLEQATEGLTWEVLKTTVGQRIRRARKDLKRRG
jgi:DNA-3-methyladenine glycosylase I